MRATFMAGLLFMAGAAQVEPLPQAGPTTLPAGNFEIGGERFAPEDVVDARMMPEITGEPAIMITLSTTAAKKLAALTTAHAGEKLPIMLDGKLLAEPLLHEPIVDGVAMISGTFTPEEAAALAKRISGKEPVPDELGE